MLIMKKIFKIRLLIISMILISNYSCTKLDEEVLDGFKADGSEGSVNTASFLKTAYEGLREFQGQGQMFTMEEMSSDALVGPTRGGDWDDNGKWRQFHTHTWTADNEEIRGAWNTLLSNVYNCNQVIYKGGTSSEIIQARFLRAFYYYNVIDLFGQAPYREANTPLTDDPKVWTRTEATQFVISELESILSSLPPRVAGDPSIVNKDAGHFLLAKLYLNKAVFTASNPSGPYTFSAADMSKVVSNVDAMTNSLGNTSESYWNNFSPSNAESNELVFTSKNSNGSNGGNMQSRWRMGMHYNQKPDGWNGFTTLAEYYGRFNPNDKRIKYSTPDIIKNFGNPVGYQVGQIYKPGGTEIVRDRIKTKKDPEGQPLIYTPNLKLIVETTVLENAGIRGMKYIPDNTSLDKPENDYVLMRYSDALLMKAEAIVRGGSGSIGTIMSDIATRTETSDAPSPATLDGIYLERGKELWWEGWRRNDMIRFGKFLQSRELKPYVSKERNILFPIPVDGLLNSNIKQNPGY
jgi:starch-binding outer membrane protein, SusD/RagB family